MLSICAIVSSMNLKHLSKDLTTYDLLKTFAVILMIVDHVGYYFYDENDWFRLLGRLCVPVWFFLIGYARSRDLGPRMWVGAVILVISSVVAGMGALPVNILGTMIIIRLVIDPVMKRSLQAPNAIWQISTIMILLTFPTSYMFEYGTLAVIMAMFGWLVRNQHEIPGGERLTQQYFFFSMAVFTLLQIMFFEFSGNQIPFFGAGVLAVMCILMFFRPITFAGTGQGIAGVLLTPFRLMGRYTLEIYVVHLILLKAIASAVDPERFPFMDLKWVPDAMLSSTVSGVN